MPKFKICLCFSDTGGGHRSAVEAIEAGIKDLTALEGQGHVFEISTENVIEKSHPINRGFVDLYNYLLRHNQAGMAYYFWFIQTFRPNDSELGYQIAKNWVENFLEAEKPDVLVSAHPMCNQYLARALKDSKFKDTTKLVTVVTDPNGNFWRGWACPEADLTMVPNYLGRDQLIEWGVPQERIKIAGMPIHPDFSKAPQTNKGDFRHHLGLHRDKLTVCINAGWAGGGNMLSVYRQLAELDKPLQVIFLCGHNRTLYEKAKREANACHIPTAILPFHDRMSDLMSAVDLMVTKAGGLTTFEAMERRLPMALDVITKPMPQEMGTVKILIDSGLAVPLKKASDIIGIVEKLTVREEHHEAVSPTEPGLAKKGAVYGIAREILGFCDPLYRPKVDEAIVDRL
ncbi:MAG: glycosyltransferase [Candidatus Obscuribacterales bacterium]|nr:glycosyltransferase [Candidatus Obscuribacterales bacterium]